MADEPVGLEIIASRASGRGLSTLTATFHSEVVHADKVDLLKAADRRRFATDLHEARGGISIELIEVKLLTLVPLPSDKGEATTPGAGDAENHSETLLRLAQAVELFRTPDGKGYATVPLGEHEENHPISGRSFPKWLTREFYLEQGKPPSPESLRSALGVLEAKAQFEAPLLAVHTRVAPAPTPADPDLSAIYLNLAGECRKVVEITSRGWVVIDRAPVKLRSPKGMLGLPTPDRGGSLDLLRRYLNVRSEGDWRLLIAAITAMFRPGGPYPIVAIQGEQGSAKSTTTRVVRRLVDPPHHAPPKRAERSSRLDDRRDPFLGRVDRQYLRPAMLAL